MSALPEHVQAAIKSGPVPELRDWRNLSVDEMTRAERNMAFVERHCVVPEGALVGHNLKLADFQEAFFYAIYDNPETTADAYLSIARKNSKTATIATIVLVHLVGPEAQLNSEIMSGARSRDQASQVFRYASKMVKLSDTLSDIVRIIPSSKSLVGLLRNVEYKAGAAEASTSIGGSPVVAILDELGQVQGPRDDYVDAITTSQGAHENPLLIGISTQAPTDGDLWSVWLDDARNGDDDSIVCHLYEMDKDADLQDEQQWLMANPALGLFRSRKDMEKMAAKASRMPSFESTFRNLYCNQRVATTSPFIAKSVWEENGAEPQPMEGVSGWGGLDLSARTDLTALVFVWEHEGVWQVGTHVWVPKEGLRDRAKRDRVPYDVWEREGWLTATPGATVDYEWVATQIPQILGDCQVHGIAYDRWRMDVMKKELDSQGIELPLIPFGQGYKDMGPALETLEGELLNGRVAHGMHPVLTMCAANTVSSTDPAGNRKLDKAKANGRIDAMVALAMAMGIAQKEEVQGPSVYEERGILEI